MRHVPELRKLVPDPRAEIHPDTAVRYGIRDGDLVIIETKKGQMKIKVKTTDDLLPDIINVPHGWAKELNQNVLTDMEPRDPVTGYPELRALACRIKKA
jgi:anaerobic selenocysteine-containing dehydrogenase